SKARSYIISVLERGIHVGELRIDEVRSGRTHVYGKRTNKKNAVVISVLDDRFWTCVFLSSDLGFAEAYMLGYIDLPDIQGVLDLWLDNRDTLTHISTPVHAIYTMFSGLVNHTCGHNLSAAQDNAIAGYDVSNAFFHTMLGREMMYSCALWGPEEGGISCGGGGGGKGVCKIDEDALDAAQMRKIRHVLDKACVRPGDRLLEFGTGWGALAIEAAKTYGARVDTLTLSQNQKALAELRIEEAGLTDRITVHLLDYRCLPQSFHKAFDAFVSIEMVEHTGAAYHKTYFELIDWALKDKRGIAVISSTTQPESRYSRYQATDFGRKYIWPKAVLPSATALITAAHEGTCGRMTLDSVENVNYPRTLQEWDRRLRGKFDAVIAPHFADSMSEGELEIFKRKWMYLCAYARAGFQRGYATNHMLTFVRTVRFPVLRTVGL
ncbi:hypothetical protein BS47DRAFT_1305920, partial [Hydnum rufescens UP504]